MPSYNKLFGSLFLPTRVTAALVHNIPEGIGGFLQFSPESTRVPVGADEGGSAVYNLSPHEHISKVRVQEFKIRQSMYCEHSKLPSAYA